MFQYQPMSPEIVKSWPTYPDVKIHVAAGQYGGLYPTMLDDVLYTLAKRYDIITIVDERGCECEYIPF